MGKSENGEAVVGRGTGHSGKVLGLNWRRGIGECRGAIATSSASQGLACG